MSATTKIQTEDEARAAYFDTMKSEPKTVTLNLSRSEAELMISVFLKFTQSNSNLPCDAKLHYRRIIDGLYAQAPDAFPSQPYSD